MDTLFETIVFSMGTAAGLFATGQLLVRNKTMQNVLYAVGTYALCYVLLSVWAVRTGAIRSVSILLYSDISMTFVIAPVIYFAFRATISGEPKPRTAVLPHFIPAVCAWVLVVSYNVTADPYAAANGQTVPGHLATPLISALSLASDLFLFGYILASNIEARRSCRERNSRKRFRTFRFFLAGLLGASTVTLVPYIVRDESLFTLGPVCFGAVVISFVLLCLSAPGPGSALWFGTSLRRGNRLKNFDTDRLAAQLEQLVVGQRLYADPDLSLERLSRLMRIAPHQLSQLVNQRMDMNFRTYINSCRIHRIRQDLVRYPEKTILEIALDNGFNSKTAFNAEFIRLCGKSPREYRGERLRETGPAREPAERQRAHSDFG